MDWFLYDIGLRHERLNKNETELKMENTTPIFRDMNPVL